MSTTTITTIERITNAPIPHPTKIAIWLADALFNEHKKPDGTCRLSDSALDRIADLLPANVLPLFWKSLKRKRDKADFLAAERKAANERTLSKLIGKAILKRRKLRALCRSKIVSLFETITQVIEKNEDDDFTLAADPRRLDAYITGLEKWHFRRMVINKGKYAGKNYGDTLPLYACSGELEAQSLRYSRSRVMSTERIFWNVGRDGGGQPEIRFRIHPTLTKKACDLVSNIGSQSRNGGHIHLNCRKDDAIGGRVFNALRTQLVWTRFLANHARRSGRWSSVDNTPAVFSDAKRIKGAAISCNTWNLTGTVEMRLWGTTAKPEEWHFRAALMQSFARMSETETMIPTPIERSHCNRIFLDYATWAAQHDPQTLRETLHRLRKKSRTHADRIGAEVCRELVAAFDASEIRLTGYRRRSTITPVIAG
jgi:hypothetical protein